MPYSNFTSRRAGFSLLEILVVMSVLSLLAALLFPAFLAVRRKARQVSCASNLRQIGMAMTAYMQDYDGYYPYATDAADRVRPEGWASLFPQFAADIPHISLLYEVLRPYTGTSKLFFCPADIGTARDDFGGVWIDGFPTTHEKYGSSYSYLSLLAACHFHESRPPFPVAVLPIMADAGGHWHGTLVPLQSRYNILFADGHVKNLDADQFESMKGTSLNELPPGASGCGVKS